MNYKQRNYSERIDLTEIARCRMCYEQMLFIYDSELRDYCHECLMQPIFDESRAYEAYQGEEWTNHILLSLV